MIGADDASPGQESCPEWECPVGDDGVVAQRHHGKVVTDAEKNLKPKIRSTNQLNSSHFANYSNKLSNIISTWRGNFYWDEATWKLKQF